MPSPSPLQWLSLVGVIWLQSINGPNTDFPVYSSQLKHLLSISQVELNNLAFASDAGKLFGWFAGIAALYLPLYLVLLIGATLGVVGFGVQYLFLVNKISSLSYMQVFILTMLGGNAICWINTVCYIVCIKNFTSNRRVAVGLATSYVGLSAKIYNVLADVIFHSKPGKKAEAYLLLNAAAPLAVAIVAAPLARGIKSKNESKQSKGGFVVLFVIALATALCTMSGSISSVSQGLSSKTHTISLAILLSIPLVVPIGVQVSKWWCNLRELKVHGVIVEDYNGGSKEEEGGEVEGEEDEKEVRVGSMVRRTEFWLYFLGYLFGPTVGLVFLNNLGQIVESRGLVTKTSYLVSLASSSGFLGRFMPPLLDFFFPRAKISGPAFIATLMCPMAGAFFLLINPTNFALYLGTAVIGACTGAITSVAVTTTPELFGEKHFGVNHNVVVTNIPVGSFVFGYVAAVLYQRGDGSGGKCMGRGCYEDTFVVWGCLCSVGAVLSLVLHLRTRGVRVGLCWRKVKGGGVEEHVVMV